MAEKPGNPRSAHRYSPATIAAYGTALEAAFPDDSPAFVAALKELFGHVHCDIAGEVRGAHVEPQPERCREIVGFEDCGCDLRCDCRMPCPIHGKEAGDG